MEQYLLSSDVYYENIRRVIDNFQPKHIFIRRVASEGGKVVVDENLNEKTLDIIDSSKGVLIVIDGKIRFFLKFSRISGPHFVIEYFMGNRVRFPGIVDPNDIPDPLVKESFLRSSNNTYLMEIMFDGKIPLRVYSPKNKHRGWDLWEIDI